MFGTTPSATEAPKSKTLFGTTPTTESKEKEGDNKHVGFDMSKNSVKTIEKSTVETKENQNVQTGDKIAALDLNGLSIERIIARWHEKLDNHLDLFSKTADKVRERDLLLFKNQSKITYLAKQAQLLKAEQDELQWNLDSVSELQSELHYSIDQLEKELEQLSMKKPSVFNQDAAEARKEAYETVSTINSKLHNLHEDIQGTNDTLNSLQEVKIPETGGVGEVLGAMQKHQLSLDYLSTLASDLEVELLAMKSC